MHSSGQQRSGQLRARNAGTGPNLSELNMDATRRCYELEALVHPEQRNDAGMTPPKRDEDSFEEIMGKLNEFAKVLRQMEGILQNERLSSGDRAIWGKRIQGYQTRWNDFSRTLESKKQRAANQQYVDNRALLFGQRGEGAEIIDFINDINDERASLDRSNQIANEAIGTGLAVLETLQQQGSKLRGASRKLQEILSVVGMSSSLLRVIERREWGDAMIVYGGMIFTVIFLYFVYSYTH